MTKKKTTTGKKGIAKLKLKRETLKDLDVTRKGKDVKGGMPKTTNVNPTRACYTQAGYC